MLPPMSALDPLALTGLRTTHVVESPEFAIRLHPEALRALRALRDAAASAGIDLAVASGFRDYARQRTIWDAKFRGERTVLDAQGAPVDLALLDDAGKIEAILQWSALPGASRHHWGTDIDVYDRAVTPDRSPSLISAEYEPGGPYARLSEWLDEAASRFGFFRPYRSDRGGVRPEAWHLSYAPIAAPCLEAHSLAVLKIAIESQPIAGQDAVLRELPTLHRRFVHNIDPLPPTSAFEFGDHRRVI